MLIELDASAIDDALAGAGTSTRSRECIENLLQAFHAAKHVVAVPAERLADLETIAADFSQRARGALRALRAQGTEIRGLRARVHWRMRLGVGQRFDGEAVEEEGKRVVLARLHDFHDHERLGRSVLLGENLSDAALYEAMARAYLLAVLRWRGPIIAFARQGGGGSSTAPGLVEHVADGRIVIAVTDSDRKFPGDDLGGTAARLVPVARRAFQHVHVLDVRFAENLIPSALYEQAFAGKQRKLDALALLKHAETKACALPWRQHAQLKHGIRLFRIRALPAGNAEATFWRQVAIALGRDQCQQAVPPPCVAEQDCRCYVTDALGADALELVVTWLTRNDPLRNARLLGLATAAESAVLCEKLIAWGIAPAGRPT